MPKSSGAARMSLYEVETPAVGEVSARGSLAPHADPMRVGNLRWTTGNRLTLLENGEDYFPRVFGAIRRARREVIVETFVWFDDDVGRELRDALICAARAGASVEVTVDGFGTPSLPRSFSHALAEHGVRVLVFDPRPTWFGIRTNPLCRLHRKVVLVDREVAFVGGINFSNAHLKSYGSHAKQDYAVEIRGPLVREVARFHHSTAPQRAIPQRRPSERTGAEQRTGSPHSWSESAADARAHDGVEAMFIARHNSPASPSMEQHYCMAFRRARSEILLANAYFVPCARFVRQLAAAANRGVQVRLILPGRWDRAYAQAASEAWYASLLELGIRVYLYDAGSLHAKIGVVDREWATVGSSNLDPTSFGLNLEADVVVRDRGFAASLRRRLEALIEADCSELSPARLPPASLGRRCLERLWQHVALRSSRWGTHFPLAPQELRELSNASASPYRVTDGSLRGARGRRIPVDPARTPEPTPSEPRPQ